MRFVLHNVFALAGRVLLSAVFILGAIGHITNWNNSAQKLSDKLGLAKVAGVPLAHILLAGAVAFLVLGSLSMILGFRTRTGALLLLVYLIPVTAVFHNGWLDPEQLNVCVKNLALMGGLLMVMAHGSGTLGLDVFAYEPQTYK